MKDLLKFKKEKKSNNPNFIRQDHHKKKRLAKIWRKPRGCDSKKRLMKNNRIQVKPGYGTPSELRGLDEAGKEIVRIKRIEDLNEIDPKKQVVIISKRLGLKSKTKIIEEIVKKKITVHNLKDPEAYLKEQKEKKKAKKKTKKKAEEKKEEKPAKVKEQKETKKDKESIEDKLSEEEKKKLEKKEIDKLLTKKF